MMSGAAMAAVAKLHLVAPLLDEVARLGNFEGRRAAADRRAQLLHHRGAEHDVLHSHRHERLTSPFGGEELASPLTVLDARHARLDGDQLGEAAHARLVALVGERRVVGGDVEGRHVRALGRQRQQASDRNVREGSGEALPHHEARADGLSNRNRRVHHQQPREALGHLRRYRQTDDAAPVLAHQRDALEVELFDEAHHRVAMEVERVDFVAHRLVRAPEAEEVRRHHAAARPGEHRDHLPVEVCPGGLAVQAEEEILGVGRPFVDVVEPQPLESPKCLEVAGLEGEAGKNGEALFRGAQSFDLGRHRNPSWS
jgi:hypothetical protein